MSPLDAPMRALFEQVSRDIILPRYRNLAEGEIIEKAQNDLVTVADREAELALADGLEALEPGLAMVGEEAVHADASVLDGLARPCWIIDPIDGTANFAAGTAPFGILIARAEGGLAQSGWIYDCLSGRFCSAHRGQGAFVDGEPVQARGTGETPPVAALSTMFMDDAGRAQAERDIVPHYRLIDIPRCCAEQYPRLGLGQNDVSLFNRTFAWDHAAGALWLNEAGGMAARYDGSAYRVDEHGCTGLIAAATPALWQALAARATSA